MPDYEYVTDRQRDMAAKYGHLLNNTGGNDPLDLLNDMQRPSTPERPNYMMSTNTVRFTLAVAVQSQLRLLAELDHLGLRAQDGGV